MSTTAVQRLETASKQKRNDFNRPILLTKGIFFIVYAAGAILMFLPLYFQNLGLSGQQIGLLAAIPPVMTIFGASVWSAVADATQRHKQLFILVSLRSIISFLLLPMMSGDDTMSKKL